MKKTLPYEPVVFLEKNPHFNNMFDVELNNNEILQTYSSVECHLVLYPYSRNITSKDIIFCPFEEYVKDIQVNRRSAYQKSVSHFNKVFGFFLGILIVLGFYLFHPRAIFSFESILSLLGAYFIGKELWDDLENVFINVSHNWKIRYQASYYSYTLEKDSTLAFYSRLAKKNRYGKNMLLPEKIDFIQQSNSQTVRLFYTKKNFKHQNGKRMHIISIHLEPGIVKDFSEKGFMFGVKLSFNKQVGCFRIQNEYFQSIHHNHRGCLDRVGQWCENAVFYRKTMNLGRIKFFFIQGVLENKVIVYQSLS